MFKKIKQYREQKRHTELLRMLGGLKNEKVLDVSCGEGAFIDLLHNKNPGLELYGIDNNDSKINTATQKYSFANFISTDAATLPFQDELFDIVLCSMSLHHYKNSKKHLLEMVRVLKTGGALYIVDIIPKNKYSQTIYNLFGCYEPYHFEKFYTATDLQTMTKDENFRHQKEKRLSIFPRMTSLLFTKIPPK